MTEQPWDDAVDAPEDILGDVPDDALDEVGARPEPTGVERVDVVLEAVASLAERPLEEHPGVFETAHSELRATLDG